MSALCASHPVRVRVPATSANLGPGFDALGLALTHYDELEARVTDEPGLHVEVDGEGSRAVPLDESHLVVVAMRRAFAALGAEPGGLNLHAHNRIPHGRGLGSSAAAVVAGLALGRALVVGGSEAMDDDALLGHAAAMEGHPDNAAAAVLGGLTIAWTHGGEARAVRLEVHPDVVPVVCIPATPVPTKAARALLPASVPHADAAATAGRAALLVAALTEQPGLLLDATEDRLHQAYREPAMPETLALVSRLRAEGLPAVVSGAGPTVLVLAGSGTAHDVAPLAPGFRTELLAVDTSGVSISPA